VSLSHLNHKTNSEESEIDMQLHSPSELCYFKHGVKIPNKNGSQGSASAEIP